MKIVFMGTPDFAVPIFNALRQAHEVCLVCTQPDRPKGRGLALAESPVKQAALAAGVPVFQPETLRGQATRARLAACHADVFVVAAYGLLLGPKTLAIPPLGCVNAHGSLLPKYRGASPMQCALLNGDAETGISMMYMDRGMDTGDVILQRKLTIAPDENFQGLHDRMALLGAACTLEALARIADGTAARTPQDDAQATYAPLLTKADARLDWARPTAWIVNHVRAFDPGVGAYALADGQPFKIWRCEAAEADAADAAGEAGEAGAILAADGAGGIRVRTGDGAVRLLEVQAPGKKRMSAADFLRGAKGGVGFG